MSKNIKQIVNEKEIKILAKKSFQEAKNFSEIEIVKKKYLEKGGIISQLFQQIGQEKDLIKKKKLSNLISNWKNELAEKFKEVEEEIKTPYQQFRDTEEWVIITNLLAELENNQDIELKTAPEYVVGYLVEKLRNKDLSFSVKDKKRLPEVMRESNNLKSIHLIAKNKRGGKYHVY